MRRFENKIALVIGGNSGIGLAAARQLDADGAIVTITGRDPVTLEASRAELGPEATCFRGDISDPDCLKPAVAAIEARFRRIDILIVNAGIGAFATIAETTVELWDRVHNVNLRGCFFAARAALPLMQAGSALVFTGSAAGDLALPASHAYAASKAGLRALVRVMAKELVGRGIRVNMVSPGPTETPIITRNEGHVPLPLDALRDMMASLVPMGRMGDADEVAAAVLFLASPAASFITGVDLHVDGGLVEIG